MAQVLPVRASPAKVKTGVGVLAQSVSGDAIQASSTSGGAIVGTSAAPNTPAIQGNNTSPTSASNNSNIGVQGFGGIGVEGIGFYGVMGQSTLAGGAGIFGKGVATRIVGNVEAFAGHFEGNVQVTGSLNVVDVTVIDGMSVAGDLKVAGDVILTGADCAEDFDVLAEVEAEPGTVMVIGDCEALKPSLRPYDRRVAGVVSGAGAYKPALRLDRRSSPHKRSPVALVARFTAKWTLNMDRSMSATCSRHRPRQATP